MFLTKWHPMSLDPYKGFDELLKAFDGESAGFCPAVDLIEKEDHLLLKADMPGVNEKDIDVKVQDGVLLLSGKREATREKEGEGGYYRECRYGSFSRQFRLGSNVDAAKIHANYKNGVLEVKIPKREEAKPRQVKVTKN